MFSSKLLYIKEWLLPLRIRVPIQRGCAANYGCSTHKCSDQSKYHCYATDSNNNKNNCNENNYNRNWHQGKFVPKFIYGFALAFSFTSLFRKKKEEETPEDQLITTIKRSILNIQREQYDKAEQMLHLALRMAQDLQSKEAKNSNITNRNLGITYVYDVMANLAMERGQFKKAEKLFADVMQRLFSTGHNEESPKMLHISAKLAHMAQLQGDLEKAMLGFTWTLKKIQEVLKKMPEDKDLEELSGLVKYWYGQLLMKKALFAEAKKLFEEAYDCLVAIHGVNEEAITILNNMSVACMHMDNVTEAKNILLKAIELAKQLKDTAQEAILLANLGLIYLREGLITQAQETCRTAWRVGKSTKNADAIEQASYCLDEIKSV